LHIKLHTVQVDGKVMKGNQIIVLTELVSVEHLAERQNPSNVAEGATLEWGTQFDSNPFSSSLDRSEDALMPELVAYVDGGCLGNPGPSGIGVVINGCASGPVRIAKWIGHQDNNVAEYAALMEALQYALSLKARALHVFSDSQVVVRQMTGEYECRSPRLYSLHWTCRKLARALKFSISHVPREENAEANRLAQSALKRRRSSK
jgi:ribonuclease HI